MDIYQIYCGGRFIIYTNIESLCCTTESNTLSYVNYISIKNIVDNPVKKSIKENVDKLRLEGLSECWHILPRTAHRKSFGGMSLD